jgi:hypothetical protein
VHEVVASRRAGWLLIAAGLIVVIGSSLPWLNCSTVGCDSPLQAIDDVSGVAITVGWLTVVSGLVLVALGSWAVRGRFDDRGAKAAMVTGALIAAAVVVTVVLVFGPLAEGLTVRAPGLGAIVVVAGGLLATATGWWLWRIARQADRGLR